MVKILEKFSTTLTALLVFTLPLLSSSIAEHKICQNNGTMKVSGKMRTCQCHHPFTGQYCEDYACVNGLSTGLQYDPNSLFFNKRCLCDPGWTGELCSKSLINRCGDNGEDVEGKCECRKNFVGDRCQYVTKCTNGQLYNGRCACHYGWAGDFCDLIICHQGQPNETNNGCFCPPKYRGRFCDFCAEASSSPPPECAEIGHHIVKIDGDSGPIILAVVITIALVVVGAIFYLLCYKLSKTKKAKVARQTAADVQVPAQNTVHENLPLNGTQLNANSEKFFDCPPPYETLTPENKQQQSVLKQETQEAKVKTESITTDVKFTLGEESKRNLQQFEQNTLSTVDEKRAFPHVNGIETQQKFPNQNGSVVEHQSAIPMVAGSGPTDGQNTTANNVGKIYPELKNDEENGYG